MFEETDIIYAYTWDDACNDGTFVNVSRMANNAGFTLPVALTRSVFSLLEGDNYPHTDLRINTLLMLLAIHIKQLKQRGKANGNFIKYHAPLSDNKDSEVTELWVNIEARSPKNPEPVMTIMLPSDY